MRVFSTATVQHPQLTALTGQNSQADAGPSLDPRSRDASALRVSWREMLRERQVAAPLMA
jgi:hypothetical protein